MVRRRSIPSGCLRKSEFTRSNPDYNQRPTDSETVLQNDLTDLPHDSHGPARNDLGSKNLQTSPENSLQDRPPTRSALALAFYIFNCSAGTECASTGSAPIQPLRKSWSWEKFRCAIRIDRISIPKGSGSGPWKQNDEALRVRIPFVGAVRFQSLIFENRPLITGDDL